MFYLTKRKRWVSNDNLPDRTKALLTSLQDNKEAGIRTTTIETLSSDSENTETQQITVSSNVAIKVFSGSSLSIFLKIRTFISSIPHQFVPLL